MSTTFLVVLHNPYFIEIIDGFKQYCMDKDYSAVTVAHYTKQTAKFLDYADSQSVKSCTEIHLKLINNYIKTLAGYTYKTVEQQLCSLRAFLKYLYQKELIDKDYSLKIPMVQARRQTRIPSVWSAEDLKNLIAAIDRGNPMGKRDYAIILLANSPILTRTLTNEYLKKIGFISISEKYSLVH